MYSQDAYNLQGLFLWEKKVVESHFSDTHRLLVGGAGAGREMIAMHKAGYAVDGFECNADLVKSGNELLHNEGCSSSIQHVPPDECIESAEVYDGIIVGWSAYMLIQGRDKRISFLKKLRSRIQPQGPLLISFYHRSGPKLYFSLIVKVANLIRFFLRRPAVLKGDALAPNYVHYFTQEEIEHELSCAGFRLVFYSFMDYGHAVGIAE